MPFPLAAIGAFSGVIGAGGAVAGMLPTHRQCDMEITNECQDYALCNGSFHATSGSGSVPATIGPGKSVKALFTKTSGAARGAVGVITYDLREKYTNKCTKKVAVMYSVPYDFNLYSNWFAVGIFDMSTSCDYDLYCQMYHGSGRTFVRGKACDGRLTYERCGIRIDASMSDAYQPDMKVEVSN